MKAVGLYKYLPISDKESLIDIELDQPTATGHDILVAVKAISANPVDTKVRAPKDDIEVEPKILGWDAAGLVTAVGDQVEHYEVGDRVYYAGDITRSGSYAEYQLVDERIVGRMPNNLDFAQAAAMPLTSITAWEALFDRLNISKTGDDAGKSILIIGGAGGVGSIAIQLATKVAELKVIATASRPETQAWTKNLGAEHVINHHIPLNKGLFELGIESVDYVLCLNNTLHHWPAMTQVIKPQGMICSIVESPEPLDLAPLKNKSAGFVWEFMFTRAMYNTTDMIEQQRLLTQLSGLIERGDVVTTSNTITTKPINSDNLRKAHEAIESGQSIGKIVLSDWIG